VVLARKTWGQEGRAAGRAAQAGNRAAQAGGLVDQVLDRVPDSPSKPHGVGYHVQGDRMQMSPAPDWGQAGGPKNINFSWGNTSHLVINSESYERLSAGLSLN
jgi:hypothetical protein